MLLLLIIFTAFIAGASFGLYGYSLDVRKVKRARRSRHIKRLSCLILLISLVLAITKLYIAVNDISIMIMLGIVILGCVAVIYCIGALIITGPVVIDYKIKKLLKNRQPIS